MTSPLENLCGPDKPLHKEEFDSAEYAGLKHSGHVRLADAKNPSNSLEGRFDLAYNAAHSLCLAALRRCGASATAPRTATSYSRFCHKPSASAPEYGAYWINATECETKVNTKVASKLMRESSPI